MDLVVEVEKYPNFEKTNMKKKHVVDLNKKASKPQEGNKKESMLSEEEKDEEGEPMVIENDKVQSDPLPTI